MTVVQNIIVIYTRKEKYFSNMIMRNGIYHHRIIYSLNTLGCLCRYIQLNDFKSLNNIFFIFWTWTGGLTFAFVRFRVILFINIYKEFKRSLLINMHLHIKYNYLCSYFLQLARFNGK